MLKLPFQATYQIQISYTRSLKYRLQETLDYYPFGMLVPNRYAESGQGYRYGFNGQERDDELKGKGNSINYEARMQDTRIGRFLSIDPLTKMYPELTPYQFASNTPIQAIDLDGLEQYHYTLSFNKKGKPVIKYTNQTHFKYEHWKMGTSRILGVNVPVPEHYFTEDHRWVVHTGVIHTGLTPDNSQIYRMEINKQFDSKQEMLDWVSSLQPSDLQDFDDNYSLLDQVGHHLYNVQEIYQNDRPGGNLGGSSKKSKSIVSQSLPDLPEANVLSKKQMKGIVGGNGSIRPEKIYLGSKKHGIKWNEGSNLAKSSGIPQGQWGKNDLEFATQQALNLKPGESGYFKLPEGADSKVHMPDGTSQSATHIWIRNNGTGTFHGHPRMDGGTSN